MLTLAQIKALRDKDVKTIIHANGMTYVSNEVPQFNLEHGLLLVGPGYIVKGKDSVQLESFVVTNPYVWLSFEKAQTQTPIVDNRKSDEKE